MAIAIRLLLMNQNMIYLVCSFLYSNSASLHFAQVCSLGCFYTFHSNYLDKELGDVLNSSFSLHIQSKGQFCHFITFTDTTIVQVA